MSASFNATKELVQSHMALDSCNLRCWRGVRRFVSKGEEDKVNSQGWMDGWMDGWKEGWMDGGMEGCMGR